MIVPRRHRSFGIKGLQFFRCALIYSATSSRHIVAITEESGVHRSTIDDLKLWYVVVGVQSVHLGILALVGTVLDHPVRAGDRYTVHLVSGVAFFYGFTRYIRLFGM